MSPLGRPNMVLRGLREAKLPVAEDSICSLDSYHHMVSRAFTRAFNRPVILFARPKCDVKILRRKLTLHEKLTLPFYLMPFFFLTWARSLVPDHPTSMDFLIHRAAPSELIVQSVHLQPKEEIQSRGSSYLCTCTEHPVTLHWSR